MTSFLYFLHFFSFSAYCNYYFFSLFLVYLYFHKFFRSSLPFFSDPDVHLLRKIKFTHTRCFFKHKNSFLAHSNVFSLYYCCRITVYPSIFKNLSSIILYVFILCIKYLVAQLSGLNIYKQTIIVVNLLCPYFVAIGLYILFILTRVRIA